MVYPPIITPASQVDTAFWLDAAHGAIRRECGWHVAPVLEEHLILDGSGTRQLHVPSKRIVSVVSATNAGVDVTDLVDASERSGVLELATGRWTDRLGRVEIRLLHGHEPEEIPEVMALIASLARRAASSTTVTQQSVNGASVTYASAGGAPLSIPLLGIERDFLAPYRLESHP